MNTFKFDNLFSLIIKHLDGHYYHFGLIIISLLIISSQNPINAILIREIINKLNHIKQTDMAFCNMIYLLTFAMLQELIKKAHRYLIAKTIPIIKEKVVLTAFMYLHMQDNPYLDAIIPGKISSKIKDLAKSTGNSLIFLSENILTGILNLLFSCIALLSVSYVFGFIVLFAGISMTILSIFFSNKINMESVKFSNTQAACIGNIINSLTNSTIVKVFFGFNKEKQVVKKDLNDLTKSEISLLQNQLWHECIYSLSIVLFLSLVTLILYRFFVKNMLSSGDCALVLIISYNVSNLLNNLACDFIKLFMEIGTLKAAFNSIFFNTVSVNVFHNKAVYLKNLDIQFKDVGFSYGIDMQNLKHINVLIKEGSTNAIIGSSGAGKSTFIKLLAGLYKPNSGKITIGNTNINDLSKENFMKLVSIVPQETMIFNRSIFENIQYGNISANFSEVKTAAIAAGCHDFIMRFPKDYDTIIGGAEVKLSRGQKQLIAIARSILKNAPIIILDEPTASVDPIVRREVEYRLMEHTKNKTVITISHQIFSLQQVDQILVMDNGAIIEQGNHEKLLSKNGIYSKMLNTSFVSQVI